MGNEWDWDDILSYRTPKVVRIRDKNLGIWYYSLMGGILFYVVYYVFYIESRYLKLVAPASTVIPTVVLDTTGTVSVDSPDNFVQVPYCKTGYTGTLSQGGSARWSNPSAIRTDEAAVNTSDNPNLSIYDCIYMDTSDSVYPPNAYSSVFITTMLKVKFQRYACTANTACTTPWTMAPPKTTFFGRTPYSGSCCGSTDNASTCNNCCTTASGGPVSGGSEDCNNMDYFVFEPDMLRISLSHAAIATEFVSGDSTDKRYVYNSSQGNGKVVDYAGTESDLPQIVTLSQMMKWAGMGMDDQICSGALNTLINIPSTYKCNAATTRRRFGSVIIVSLIYSNTAYLDSPISYTMKIYPIKYWGYMVEQPITLTSISMDARAVYTRFGVKIIFTQTGTIGKFDFVAVLIQITTTLALTALATAFVEFLMLRYFKNRAIYHNFKFEQTAEFIEVLKKEQVLNDDPRGKILTYDQRIELAVKLVKIESVPEQSPTEMEILANPTINLVVAEKQCIRLISQDSDDGEGSDELTDTELQLLFKLIDDGNGQLEVDEVAKAFEIMKLEVDINRIKKLFKRVTASGNGSVINQVEFKTLMKAFPLNFMARAQIFLSSYKAQLKQSLREDEFELEDGFKLLAQQANLRYNGQATVTPEQCLEFITGGELLVDDTKVTIREHDLRCLIRKHTQFEKYVFMDDFKNLMFLCKAIQTKRNKAARKEKKNKSNHVSTAASASSGLTAKVGGGGGGDDGAGDSGGNKISKLNQIQWNIAEKQHDGLQRQIQRLEMHQDWIRKVMDQMILRYLPEMAEENSAAEKVSIAGDWVPKQVKVGKDGKPILDKDGKEQFLAPESEECKVN